MLTSKLPKVGTTIFTTMSQLAAERHEALHRDTREGKNQYAPMTGVPALRQAIARKVEQLYGCKVDSDTEITVTSGATEAIFAAVHAVVRPGEEVIVLDPCYDSYEPSIELAGARTVHLPLIAP